MPKFESAEVVVATGSISEIELAQYRLFLSKYPDGSRINLPLADGETSRVVMRYLNASANILGKKIHRISSNETVLTFRLVKERDKTRKSK